MTVEPSIVLTRLKFISDYLRKLRRFESMSLEEYLDNFDHKTISERMLELIFQAAIDINEHILTQTQAVESITNKESFIRAGECGVITPELADQLVESAGLRNILAHQYLNINYVDLFDSIQKALTRYPIYIQQVTKYLDSLEVGNDEEK